MCGFASSQTTPPNDIHGMHLFAVSVPPASPPFAKQKLFNGHRATSNKGQVAAETWTGQTPISPFLFGNLRSHFMGIRQIRYLFYDLDLLGQIDPFDLPGT